MKLARIVIGIFFIMSGISLVVHFNDFYQSVLTSKLKLWGLGFEGIGPLPPFMAIPYAYALPVVEILAGAAFAAGFQVRWVGLLMLAILASIIMATGLLPDQLFPNARAPFNKDVIIAAAIYLVLVKCDNNDSTTRNASS